MESNLEHSAYLSQQTIEPKSLELNNIVNKLLSFNYDGKFKQKDQIDDDITKLFDILLWAQKNNPQLVYELFSMQAIEQINQIHIKSSLITIFKNFVIILMNCKQAGILAQLFLNHQLTHFMLQELVARASEFQDGEESVEYIGSYLKAYHRVFRAEWLEKFILSDGYFELLEVSFKFWNCPEPLTKTTVFNIVLALLGHSEVKNFILETKRLSFYEQMAQQITSNIKNEIIDFGEKVESMSIKSSVGQVISQIEDKIALWEDISVACSGILQLFQIPFSKNVLLPILIGSLKYELKPLFTLKFSLFILSKLMTTIHNFGLLEVFVRMIFFESNVFYWPHTLAKVPTQQFIIGEIINKKISQLEEHQKQDYGDGIKKFYQGVLRSKDNHFILMSTSLNNSIHKAMKNNEEVAKCYGTVPGGCLFDEICQKLILQLSQTHRLISIECLLNCITVLNQSKCLNENLQNMFVFVFKKVISETKSALKSKSQLWDFMIEINQYDLLKAHQLQLGKQITKQKLQEIFKVVFMWDIKQEQSSFFSFYSSIPDTVEDNFRYLYAKYLMMRKAAQILISNPPQTNIVTQYYSKIVSNSQYRPNQIYKIFQIRNFHECEIMENKLTIPAVWIVDENFFILGHFQRQTKQVRIIMAIKYKHISAEMASKKQKIMVRISVKSYDQKTQRLRYKNSLTVKGIETLMHKLIAFQIKIREKQMVLMSGSIKKTQESLPTPNLL